MKTFPFSSLLSMALLSVLLSSCGPKDTDIQKAVTEKISNSSGMSDMMVSVNKGVVTLSGQCKDETCKSNCEKLAKEIKGVKSVINNCTVAPPPPVPAPVVINADETLSKAVMTLLAKYPGVSSTISNGVVTLNGEIKKANLMPLMQSLQALNPKKVENKLTVK